MKSSSYLPAVERAQFNFASIPPLGPKGLCFEIGLHGGVSQPHRSPEAALLQRLRKRARLYHGLAQVVKSSS